MILDYKQTFTINYKNIKDKHHQSTHSVFGTIFPFKNTNK